MKNKYIIVRKNSTSGAYIVERNECAPETNQWTKADVADYADTLREAETIARNANEDDKDDDGPHYAGCVCATCSGAELTSDND